MSRNSLPSTIATVGIDIGKNTFHLVGLADEPITARHVRSLG